MLKPEYESARAAAEKYGVTLGEVCAEAVEALDESRTRLNS